MLINLVFCWFSGENKSIAQISEFAFLGVFMVWKGISFLMKMAAPPPFWVVDLSDRTNVYGVSLVNREFVAFCVSQVSVTIIIRKLFE